eukprot:COSAG06_NODE_866_length_11869_cov_7.914019_6_plen_251_part_00
MGIWGWDHIIVQVVDMDAGVASYTALLGPPRAFGANDEMGISLAVFDLPSGGYIELAAPTSADSAISAALEKSGEGVMLMAFQVTDMAATVAAMKARGVRVLDADPSHVMLHPKSTNGVLIQLEERDRPDGPGFTVATAAGNVPQQAGSTGIVSYKCCVVRVSDIQQGIKNYEALGLECSAVHENTETGMWQAIFRLQGGGLIELVAPLDPSDSTNAIVQQLELRGEGMNNLSLDGSMGKQNSKTSFLKA